MSDRDKDVEMVVLRHQLAFLQRQLGPARRHRPDVDLTPRPEHIDLGRL